MCAEMLVLEDHLRRHRDEREFLPGRENGRARQSELIEKLRRRRRLLAQHLVRDEEPAVLADHDSDWVRIVAECDQRPPLETHGPITYGQAIDQRIGGRPVGGDLERARDRPRRERQQRPILHVV